MFFSEDYFQDEVRNDFYVSGIMKRAWAAQLTVLEEIDRICHKHNIRWFADSGTLLGAVRHGGFIPWDDDIDICMLREDYDKFLAVANNEFDNHCRLMTLYDESPFYYLYSRVINTDVVRTERDFLDKYNEVLFPVGVDIFPVDYISDDIEREKARLDLINVLKNILANVDAGIETGYEKAIEDIEEITGVVWEREMPFKQKIFILLDNVAKLFSIDESTYVTKIIIYMKKNEYKCKRAAFDDICMLPFEKGQIQAPVDYEAALKWVFGSSYMEMIIAEGEHSYPYFEKKSTHPEIVRFFSAFKYKFQEAHIHKLRRSSKNDIVVFLCYQPKYWYRYDKMWQKHRENGDEVYVIPIPYYSRMVDGIFVNKYYDLEGYPEYIDCLSYKKYDLKELKPDKIYIQSPYDQYNFTTSIEPAYYASNIWEYTNELVYIPFFEMKSLDISKQQVKQTMEYFCSSPGVVYSDKVLLDTEEIRNAYIEYLVEMAGEETRSLWENKIEVM